MIEGIVLGTIQGITEWLPISSEAAIILVKTRFFCGESWYGEGVCAESLRDLIGLAVFLHLGTFLAAMWYFRDDVVTLAKTLLLPHKLFQREERFLILRFLIVSTFISGILGYFLIEMVVPRAEEHIELGAKAVTLGIGILLVITGFFLLQAKGKKGQRGVIHLRDRDGVLLGFVQGFTALPGFSRSGLTISTLLLRKFEEISALRLSFLMSLPAVLGGNILLNARGFEITLTAIFGLIFSFLFGMLTMHLLFKVAKKVNFGWFVLIFAALVIASVFV